MKQVSNRPSEQRPTLKKTNGGWKGNCDSAACQRMSRVWVADGRCKALSLFLVFIFSVSSRSLSFHQSVQALHPSAFTGQMHANTESGASQVRVVVHEEASRLVFAMPWDNVILGLLGIGPKQTT